MRRAIRRVSRYSEILGVLVRYGFTDLVRKVDSDAYRRMRGGGFSSRRARKSWSRPERLRRALEELGPTFVKIGQLLSHRPDILPPDWIEEFERLRGDVPPVSAEEARAVILEDLGKSPTEIFTNFDTEALASGSIAQVHRATLPDGTNVAVKIQRPGIKRVINADLTILKDIARLVERRVPSLAMFRPMDAIRELERALRNELDFRNELENLEIFRRNFISDLTVSAPQPFREYSGMRVLTMKYIDGIPVGDGLIDQRSSDDRILLARRGANAVLRQIFEHRFFHSDPHGDNILILEDNSIVFLDFGQVGTILPSQRQFLADLLTALIHFDAKRAVRAILGWSGYRDPDEARRFTVDMEMVIERYLARPFGKLNMGEMISALIDLIRRYGIDIPSNFYLLGKSMSTIEDIASGLDPDFDFIRASRPFARKMIRSEFSPERVTEHLAGAAGDTARLLRDLPGEARDIVSLLKAGKLRMEFELKDMDTLNSTVKRVVTRLSAAVLLASMIMGSSILVQSLIPPFFYGVPVIGILGFFMSGMVGIYLLYDLWRHR